MQKRFCTGNNLEVNDTVSGFLPTETAFCTGNNLEVNDTK